VKFTEQGEVFLNVGVQESADSSGRIGLVFRVRDTGIGISKEGIEKLFQPFVQADGSTSRKYGGTGLGLAICRELSARMGGTISVKSEPGKGSEFSFTAYFEKGPVSEESARAHAYAGVRCLVVDDNATNREILRRYLEAWHVHVVTAASGAEAIKILQSEKPMAFDLVMLDMFMPGMDGEELEMIISKNPEWANLRLMLLSSVPGVLSQQRLLEVGIRTALTKPVRQSLLLTAIGRTLAGTRFVPPSGISDVDGRAIAPLAADLLKGVSILTAEDVSSNRLVLRLQLKKFGGETDFATNGQEALEAVRTGKYRIIFMDCHMPGMDGFETVKHIRALEAAEPDRPRAWIVACTADAMKEDEASCLAAGMDDYIPKPITIQHLGAVLERAMAAIGA
jgi:CheY-like chemotaxis protein